jgi:prepilin-type N-terminal cleavage/methylation domain-containing protein
MGDYKNSRGFTLVEILFALFVGLLLMAAVSVTMISGQRSSAAIERKVAAQQDVRGALRVMASEIGMASFNPNFAFGIWRNAGACSSPAVTQANKGLQEVTPNSITVEMDIGESSSIGDDNHEIIRYEFIPGPAGQFIQRAVNCGGAEAFLGAAPAAGVSRTVRVINDMSGITNGNSPPEVAVFRYYDIKDPPTELFPHQNPSDIPNIRRIDITLAVETDEIDPNTQQRRQMIYSTSVIARNHALTQ